MHLNNSFNEKVLLLDMEFKPAYSAIVRDCNASSHQYKVDYQHPGSDKTEKIWAPQERLASLIDITNSLNGKLKE